MKANLFKCDNCDKQTEDEFENHWIHIKAGFPNQSVTISITAGTDEYRKPANYGLASRERFDFCCPDCFRSWIAMMYDERNEAA